VDPATDVAGTPATRRKLLPAMRVLLVAFSVLTALAVVALFILSNQTDQSFAWTIAPPLTAAFLGAGYAAGCTLVVMSLRDPVWVNSRLPVLTILAFTVLTLAATLLHIDRFHFQPEFAGLPLLARAAAWFWIGVYIVIPVAMIAVLVVQERTPGADPPRRHPVPRVLRAALAVESVVLLAVGVALYAVPATGPDLWPWALTPLTARAVAAWLIAFGVATGLAAVAGDLERLRTAAVAYTGFGALVLVAVARYPGTMPWDRPVAWLLVVMAAAVTVTGAAGWRVAPAPGRSRS
jgi:hypothetical protein